MRGQSPWTDIIITILKQTWSEGRPAAEIPDETYATRTLTYRYY